MDKNNPIDLLKKDNKVLKEKAEKPEVKLEVKPEIREPDLTELEKIESEKVKPEIDSKIDLGTNPEVELKVESEKKYVVQMVKQWGFFTKNDTPVVTESQRNEMLKANAIKV